MAAPIEPTAEVPLVVRLRDLLCGFGDEAGGHDVGRPGAAVRLGVGELPPALEALGDDLVGGLAAEHALA